MGYSVAVVVSDSMKPTTERGDLLLFRTAPGYRAGDVIVFRRQSISVVHRIVKRNSDGQFVTKGDANQGNDAWLVNAADIEGRAAGSLRGWGLPLLLFRRGDGVSAAWSDRVQQTQSAVSVIWTSPVMTWTKYANVSVMPTSGSATIQLNGSGDRKLWSAVRYPGDTKMHFLGNLTQIDNSSPGFNFIFNACVSATDQITCGFGIRARSNNFLSLHLIQATGAFGPALAQCPLNQNLFFTNRFSIHRFGDALSVFFNRVPCIYIPSVTSLTNGSVPTGNHAGVQALGVNRVYASRFIVW
jgi:signal peptidase I